MRPLSNSRSIARPIALLRRLVVALALGCHAATRLQAAGFGGCPLTGGPIHAAIKPVRDSALTVETNLPAPGWWNGDTPDTMTDGFEYCLAANIAHRLGLDTLHVVNVAFEALVTGRTRAYDLALSQISITDERRKVVDFSTPYYVSNIGVLTRRGARVDGANIRGLRIGVQSGTTGASFVDAGLKPVRPPLVFSDATEMFTALLAGQIDVGITDVGIVLGLAGASRGRFVVAGQYRTDERYGAIFPRGSPNGAAIDAIIRDLARDGTLGLLAGRYLAGPWGVDPESIPVFAP